jgi:hypothetical protein
MNCRSALLLSLALLFPLSTKAQSSPALHQVRTIHVASMGSGSEAQRFRALLQDELRSSGFETSATPPANATLTGDFSSEARGDSSSAHVNLILKSPDGKRTLWSGDYVSQHKGTTPEDVVKTLAQTCAERLRKDWEKN